MFLRPVFGLCSAALRACSVPTSPLLRECFGYCSAVLRDVPEALSKRTRSRAEADSKPSRSGLEAEPKRSRTCLEQAPKRSRSVAEEHSKGSRKAIRRGVGASPSSDFFLTNFAPTSAFHAVGHQSPSNFPLIFPEGDPKPTRINSEQRWEKGRSWSGVGRILKWSIPRHERC